MGNIGHFDNEIDMAGLAATAGVHQDRDQAAGPRHSIIVPSEGRLMNLSNATGHPSFVMSNSFSNQTIAQIELFNHPEAYADENGSPTVTTCPSTSTRRSPASHLDAPRRRTHRVAQDQAEYLGVDVAGPASLSTIVTDSAPPRRGRTSRLRT